MTEAQITETARREALRNAPEAVAKRAAAAKRVANRVADRRQLRKERNAQPGTR